MRAKLPLVIRGDLARQTAVLPLVCRTTDRETAETDCNTMLGPVPALALEPRWLEMPDYPDANGGDLPKLLTVPLVVFQLASTEST